MPDFPWYTHRNGQSAKTIKGKTSYFGLWDDLHRASERYLASTIQIVKEMLKVNTEVKKFTY